jgi:hypothetical protein
VKLLFVLLDNIITIKVPLILKVRDINFFFAGKTYNGEFHRVFEGAETILESKRSQSPPKTPRNAPLHVLPQTKK